MVKFEKNERSTLELQRFKKSKPKKTRRASVGLIQFFNKLDVSRMEGGNIMAPMRCILYLRITIQKLKKSFGKGRTVLKTPFRLIYLCKEDEKPFPRGIRTHVLLLLLVCLF